MDFIKSIIKNSKKINIIYSIITGIISLIIFELLKVKFIYIIGLFFIFDMISYFVSYLFYDYMVKIALLGVANYSELMKLLSNKSKDIFYVKATKEAEKRLKVEENLKDNLKKSKEQIDNQENLFESKENRQIKFAKEVINFFLENYDKLSESYKSKLGKIYIEVLNINVLIDENTKRSININNTLYIFFKELFEIINILETINDKKRIKYINDFDEICEKLDKYLTNLKEKIENEDYNIDVSINTLLNKLNSEIEIKEKK